MSEVEDRDHLVPIVEAIDTLIRRHGLRHFLQALSVFLKESGVADDDSLHESVDELLHKYESRYD